VLLCKTQEQEEEQEKDYETILSKPKISLTPFKTQKNIEKQCIALCWIILETNK
jgi:hypothetical protein